MKKVIVLKLDDPDDFFYNAILSLISSHSSEVQIITGDGTKISVAPELTIHQTERRVFSSDSEIVLTRKEYDIFLYLIQNANQVLTFTQIYEHVWKEADYGTGQEVVSHHVRSLRRKLQLNDKSGCRICSVRGIVIPLSGNTSIAKNPG